MRLNYTREREIAKNGKKRRILDEMSVFLGYGVPSNLICTILLGVYNGTIENGVLTGTS